MCPTRHFLRSLILVLIVTQVSTAEGLLSRITGKSLILAQESESYRFVYPSAELEIRQTPRYVLFLHEEDDAELEIESVETTLQEALRIVAREMGEPLQRQVHVFFPVRIISKKDDGKIAGLRFDRGAQSCIAFKAPNFGPAKARHEFVHEWFRSNPKFVPVHWSIEEGICEYFEHPGEVHPKHIEYLREHGAMPRAALDTSKRQASEKWIRATRWLQVYWLRHLAEEPISLREVAALSLGEYPRPQTALDDLLNSVKENAPEPPPTEFRVASTN